MYDAPHKEQIVLMRLTHEKFRVIVVNSTPAMIQVIANNTHEQAFLWLGAMYTPIPINAIPIKMWDTDIME